MLTLKLIIVVSQIGRQIEQRKKPRKRFEKNFNKLEELQKRRRMCSSSSDSDDDRNRNSSSPSDTDDDAGKRYNKHNKHKTRRAKTVGRKARESSKVNHDQGSQKDNLFQLKATRWA